MENCTSGITTAKDDLVFLNNRIINQVGNHEITVIFDPLSSCTTNELSLLREEVEIGLSGHFNGPGFASDSLYFGYDA